MTIYFPLSLPGNPAVDIASARISMFNVVGVSESPFTYEQQVFDYQAGRWGIEVTLNPLHRIDAEPWRAWLASLRGRYGTFLMGDPTGVLPRGSAGGAPKVRVDSQTGLVLDIYDATTSVNSWLLPGDYIQLGGASAAHIHRVLNVVTTNGSGAGLIDIWPRLRTIPASGATITVNSTVGVWRLIENTVTEEIVAPGLYGIQFTALEAL